MLAQVAQSRAGIDPDTQAARLSLTLESGPAYQFGGLRIDGLRRFDSALVERIARLKPGATAESVQRDLDTIQARNAEREIAAGRHRILNCWSGYPASS